MKIKVLGNHSDETAKEREWRSGYVFTSNPSCADYDWLVVYDELPCDDRGTFHDGFEPLRCPKERTILLTWEPVSIKGYSRAYTRQFGHLLTNRPPEAENHPHYHLGRGYYLWFNGHASMAMGDLHPSKTREISVVCSSKQMRHSKHHARYCLVSEMAKAIPGLDWFGKGVRPIEKKYEAMDAYRYHVVIENHVGVHHWTEKLADAFLSECLPFYAGDPAIFEVFPRESLIPIPIDDPHEAIRIVREAIASGEYEKRREAVREAKRLILEKYNFWDQVIAVIESASGQPVTPVNPMAPVRLFARKALRRHSVAAVLEDAWWHLRHV